MQKKLQKKVSQIKEKDIDMKGFDKFIYHPDSGYLANNYGKVRYNRSYSYSSK